MTTKLTIDEGNSSTKVALWRGDTIVAESVCTSCGSVDDIAAVAGLDSPVDSAIFCTVRRGRDRQAVEAALRQHARRVIYLEHTTPMPVELGYTTPGTLGRDRIAAAVGATVVAPGRQCLVVDMGTAITYDVVTAAGKFIGGNIAPGIFVRLEALNHFTSALPLVETDGDCPRWGYDTETAMRSGAIRGVVGELQYYRHCLEGDVCVILTGGSADLILPFISTPVVTEPNLVLIGLNRIIDYNENI